MLILTRPSREAIKQQWTSHNCLLHFYQVYANIVDSINEAKLIVTIMASPEENINNTPQETQQIEQLAHHNIPENGLVVTNYQLNRESELPSGLEIPAHVGIRAGALALQDTFKNLSFDDLASYGGRPPLSEPQTIPVITRSLKPLLSEDEPDGRGPDGGEEPGELVEAELIPEDEPEEDTIPEPDDIPEVEEVPEDEPDEPDEPETPPEPLPEVDPFFSPEVEEPVPVQLVKISTMQASLAGAKKMAAQTQNNFGYDSALAKNAPDFIDLLASSVAQEHLDKVQLSQEGLEMIAHGLGALPDRPTPDMLFKLSRVFVAQNIQAVVPFTIDPVTRERIPDHHAAVTKPRYISAETGQRFGPYLSREEDLVAKAVESLSPTTWLLDDSERSHLEQIVQLRNLVVEPKPYNRPPRRISLPGSETVSDLVHTRKEAKHNASTDAPNPDEYDTSRLIVARYQKRLPQNVGDLRFIPGKVRAAILEAAQKDALQKLQRDDELRLIV